MKSGALPPSPLSLLSHLSTRPAVRRRRGRRPRWREGPTPHVPLCAAAGGAERACFFGRAPSPAPHAPRRALKNGTGGGLPPFRKPAAAGGGSGALPRLALPSGRGAAAGGSRTIDCMLRKAGGTHEFPAVAGWHGRTHGRALADGRRPAAGRQESRTGERPGEGALCGARGRGNAARCAPAQKPERAATLGGAVFPGDCASAASEAIAVPAESASGARRLGAGPGKRGAPRERAAAGARGPGRDAPPGRTGAAPAVSTSSIYRPGRRDGGRRILVTRYYPRGVRRSHFDDWARALAPSGDLLKRYKEGSITWRAFAGAFLAEVRGSAEARSALRGLRRTARAEGVTLLCYEPAGVPCHRHILRRLVEQPRLSWNRSLEPGYADYHRGVPVAGPASR